MLELKVELEWWRVAFETREAFEDLDRLAICCRSSRRSGTEEDEANAVGKAALGPDLAALAVV